MQPPLGPLGTQLASEKAMPFASESPMTGDPVYSWASFRRPRLRACTLPRDKIVWREKIGMGMDGVVWRVEIGSKPYAVKVVSPLTCSCAARRTKSANLTLVLGRHRPCLFSWAAQGGCHNVAPLQAIQASIKSSNESIYLSPDPKSRSDAMANLFACSQERRLSKPFKNLPGRVRLSSPPRKRECFGWVRFSSQELLSLPRDLRAGMILVGRHKRHLLPGKEYYAIVYEFIPDHMPLLNDDSIQAAFDFFWLSGFTFMDLRTENWWRGIFLDAASFISPVAAPWSANGGNRVDIQGWPKNYLYGPAGLPWRGSR